MRPGEMMRDGVRSANLRLDGVRRFLRIRNKNLSRPLSMEATIESRQCSHLLLVAGVSALDHTTCNGSMNCSEQIARA